MIPGPWVVVYTEIRKELSYVRYVCQAGIEAYVPIAYRQVKPRRKWQPLTIAQPLFARYAFTRLNIPAPGYIKTLCNKAGEPFHVDDEIIDDLKSREARGEFDTMKGDGLLFISGDWAMVGMGLLEGWVGKVVQTTHKYGLLELHGKRVKLTLDMLKRAPYPLPQPARHKLHDDKG